MGPWGESPALSYGTGGCDYTNYARQPSEYFIPHIRWRMSLLQDLRQILCPPEKHRQHRTDRCTGETASGSGMARTRNGNQWRDARIVARALLSRRTRHAPSVHPRLGMRTMRFAEPLFSQQGCGDGDISAASDRTQIHTVVTRTKTDSVSLTLVTDPAEPRTWNERLVTSIGTR